MKKKGFTLIELLGTVILLGIIALIIFPIANGIIKESKERAYKVQIEAILEASHKWGVDNTDLLPEEDTDIVYKLNLSDLITEGYLEDSSDIKDPRTNKVMDGCVSIKYSSSYNQYVYEYKENDYCDSLPLQVAITINKEKNEKGWLNEDFYAIITGSGDTFKYCVANGSECTPNKIINENELSVRALLITEETSIENKEEVAEKAPKIPIPIPSYICAQSFRGAESSSVECVEYKLDKTKPFIAFNNLQVKSDKSKDLGIDILPAQKKNNGWFNTPVIVGLYKFDNLSGIVESETFLKINNSDTVLMGNPNGIIYGDVIDDGEIDVSDIIHYMQYVKGWDVEIESEIGDLNKDSAIDAIDVTLLSKYVAQWWGYSFPFYQTTQNGKDMPISIETVDNAGNKSVVTEFISIDTIGPTKPEIQGGREIPSENAQTISIKKHSEDNLSGLDYYIYCIKDSNETPGTCEDGKTNDKVVINTNMIGKYIFYRGVDKAGNQGEWSESEKINVSVVDGDFDFALNYKEFLMKDIKCVKNNKDCTDYNIKYLQGKNDSSYVISNGIDITTSKKFTINNNDIYTIVLYTGNTEVKTKQIYLHNTNESSNQYQTLNVNLDVDKIENYKTSSGTITASFDNHKLNVILSNGDTTSGSSYDSYSCPSGGSGSYSYDGSSCSFSGTGYNYYENQGNGDYVETGYTNNVDCGDVGIKTWGCPSEEEVEANAKGEEKIDAECWGRCDAPPIIDTYYDYYYGYTFGIEVE